MLKNANDGLRLQADTLIYLNLSEKFWLATGLQILESLTPEAVVWIQQNTVWLLANKSVTHKHTLKSH